MGRGLARGRVRVRFPAPRSSSEVAPLATCPWCGLFPSAPSRTGRAPLINSVLPSWPSGVDFLVARRQITTVSRCHMAISCIHSSFSRRCGLVRSASLRTWRSSRLSPAAQISQYSARSRWISSFPVISHWIGQVRSRVPRRTRRAATRSSQVDRRRRRATGRRYDSAHPDPRRAPQGAFRRASRARGLRTSGAGTPSIDSGPRRTAAALTVEPGEIIAVDHERNRLGERRHGRRRRSAGRLSPPRRASAASRWAAC